MVRRGWGSGSLVCVMNCGFSQWIVGFRNESWVFAMNHGFSKGVVGLRNGLWVFAIVSTRVRRFSQCKTIVNNIKYASDP